MFKYPSNKLTALVCRLVLWALVYVFLLGCLHPELILSNTPPAGGDMAGHYPSVVYLKEHLLPQGRVAGWHPGNYAGHPLFQLYFPLPFLLAAVLSLAGPLAVAFKMVTVAGVLSLPVA
ncbi:MAG: hypothetical protein V1742_08200, partial [Pseudomonadota bacterium]